MRTVFYTYVVVRNVTKKLALMCFSCARSAQQINCGHAEQKIRRATLLKVTFFQHLLISQKIKKNEGFFN